VAAAESFAEPGVEATLDEVAWRAGVGVGSRRRSGRSSSGRRLAVRRCRAGSACSVLVRRGACCAAMRAAPAALLW